MGGGMYDTRVFLGLDWIEPWGEGAGPFDETTRMNFFFFFFGRRGETNRYTEKIIGWY